MGVAFCSLDIPKSFQIQNNAKQSVFGYPAHLKSDEKKVAEKKTVKLSTTNRVKARQNKKEAERLGGGELSLKQGESQMSLEQQQSQNLGKSQSAVIEDTSMKVEEPPKKEEPPTCILNNPTRVLEKQKKVINWVEGRYQPLFRVREETS